VLSAKVSGGPERRGIVKPNPAYRGPRSPSRKVRTHHADRGESPIQKILRQDNRESAARLAKKTAESKAKWGKSWRDMVRSGRRFSRVETIEPTTAEGDVKYVLRPEPGWLWICFNCKTRSLVTDTLIAIWKVNNQEIRTDMMAEWVQLAQKTEAGGFQPPARPTPATCPCPNCKARPGAPE
jgi:hypothetical protein